MNWFKGDVAGAITKAKSESKLFVVYVEDGQETSKKMENILDGINKEKFSNELIAIKLTTQSDHYKMFSQIYPVLVIPSTYLIDIDGVPVEIVGGASQSLEEFEQKLESALKLHKSKVSTRPSQAPLSSGPSASSSSGQAAATSISTTDCPGGVCAPRVSPPRESSPKESAAEKSARISEEEKIERAKQLLEEVRLKKQKEEEEKERQRELERIQTGKAVQQFKKNREEEEMKELLKERERAKREEKLARERVLAQIAADRAERKEREAMTKVQACAASAEAPACKFVPKSQRPPAGSISRIQFRLPDGRSLANQFNASDNLETLVKYLQQNAGLRSFSLSTTFPKRIFVDDDMPKSLSELELIPSAVLLVLPASLKKIAPRPTASGSSASASSASGSGPVSTNFFSKILALFYFLVSPLLSVWRTLAYYLWGGGGDQAPRARSPTPGPSDPSSSRPPGSNFYQREGNVARLRTLQKKKDDDNNTWNGNSTEQM